MNLRQLVLIDIGYRDGHGEARSKTGTGYFITPRLILTSNHVLPESSCDRIRARTHEQHQWIEVAVEPVWKSKVLDAVLLYAITSLDGAAVEWQANLFTQNQRWESVGYPKAFADVQGESVSYKSAGLDGQLYFGGGGGQVEVMRLDLTVTAAPTDPENWRGISGAPVFVEGKLVGIIKNVPANFKERLEGIPSYELLRDAGFRAAIEEQAFEIPTGDRWAVMILGDGSDEDMLLEPLRSGLGELFGEDFRLMVISVRSLLENPGKLLHAVRLLCRAPYLYIDATGFQPGIMLLLGIRAVVRRAITIVLTTASINENELADLPFNIQEIKLISLSDVEYITPKDKIKAATTGGLAQSGINPSYLDLPAYDAIRNPVIFDIPAIREKTLVLCSFKKSYPHYFFIRQWIANYVPTPSIVRMRDIASPQLVGQSLYEHIRWSKRCIIDWTEWAANVFYELGVRMAASGTSPANLISKQEVAAGLTPQQELLRALFEPYVYDPVLKKFPAGIKDYFNYINGHPSGLYAAIALTRVHPANIYVTAEEHFDWAFEKRGALPHQQIQQQIERSIGRDVQGEGRNNILYSTNSGYNQVLQQYICEQWLAAWYYLYHSQPENIAELVRLGTTVVAALDRQSAYRAKADEVFSIVEELRIRQSKDEVVPTLIQLKDLANIYKKRNRYQAAIDLFTEAIELAGGQPDELADCCGQIGGIYRRWAFTLKDEAEQKKLLQLSYQSYDKGYAFEREGSKASSYNLLNRLVVRIFYEPQWLRSASGPSPEKTFLQTELEKAYGAILEQVRQGRDDIWGWADLGLVMLLLNPVAPIASFDTFLKRFRTNQDYQSLIDTLRPLADLPIDAQGNIQAVIQFLERNIAGEAAIFAGEKFL